jgi:preprotein translocase subunit YajC
MSSLVAATSSSGSSTLLIFALPLLLIGWMYFTQRRRGKESRAMQSSLGIGDEVTTTSGLFGRITDLTDSVATLEVSPGVTIRFNRRAIAGPAPARSDSSAASGSPAAASEPETDGPSDPKSITD